MSITFHCVHCGKKIEAQDRAGGKWGKCPACHNKIYVPELESDEELKLAPIDETDEETKKRLIAETYQLSQDILREREIPNAAAPLSTPTPAASEEDLTQSVVSYLRQMADGDLDSAMQTARLIVPFGRRSLEILDRMAVSDMPEPELGDIPPQVLSGLIRNLREQIG
jgi:DNA-directed RNA polymerase subunit RPC12/RpoP